MTVSTNYFITLDNQKKIVMITDATPAHELVENQIELTKDEYYFIKACNGDLFKAKSLLHEIEKKIKEYKK